jgi:uncharacterized protein with HEPN domain
MSRDPQFFLDDLYPVLRKGDPLYGRHVQAGFCRRRENFDAVLRNLEVIGEAAKHVAETEAARGLGVDWRKVIALRNVISHVYFGIDPDIVWDVVRNKVPELLKATRPLKD